MRGIVITGSTKGIGFALAQAFLQRGYAVMISGRSETQLNLALSNLHTQFPHAAIYACRCDVSNIENVQHLWFEAIRQLGQVDIWINNAGTSTAALAVHQMSADEIQATVQTNILGSMFGAQVAVQGMLKQGHGQIFNMEGWGSRGEWSSGMSIYGATKRSVSYFSRALAKEHKHSPIQIGTLSPGMVATDLLMSSWQQGEAKNWQKMKRLFLFIIDPPEIVCDYLATQILANTQSNRRIVWMTPWRLLKRFFQPYYWRRNPIQDTALNHIHRSKN